MNPVIENNFKYHSPTSDQVSDYANIRNAAKGVAYMFEALCPPSREKALAMTNLEQAVMWANAAIARNSEEAK